MRPTTEPMAFASAPLRDGEQRFTLVHDGAVSAVTVRLGALRWLVTDLFIVWIS
jgi:hypothetical protein